MLLCAILSLAPRSVFPATGCQFLVPCPTRPTHFDLFLFQASERMARSSEADSIRRDYAADSENNEAGPSCSRPENLDAQGVFSESEDYGSENGARDRLVHSSAGEEEEAEGDFYGFGDGMDLEGFSGSKEKVVKPLTPEALAAFKAAKEKTGVIYISRIPPGMRPTKVRHLMSQYGEIGKVYLQQEGEYATASFLMCSD